MREYRARRRAEGAPDSTINRELSVVRAAYRLAWKDDLITLADIPHFPIDFASAGTACFSWQRKPTHPFQ